MKILFDIGHPAHVHYFRNIIRILESNGHYLIITSRDKDVTLDLLEYYELDNINIGKNLKGLFGKIISIIRNDIKLLQISLSFKPDLIISFFLPFPSHIGFITKTPVIGLTDTEHAIINHIITNPFTDVLLTPQCYKSNHGIKQIRFNGYMELCYLHPKRFTPDPHVLNILGVKKGEKYVIIRLVAWNASHDRGHTGISIDNKIKAVKEFSKYAKVFITSEGKLPNDLKRYQINISPEKMHDVLYYASLLYGESATMASECAVLGTPAIFLDNIGRGYTDELEKMYGLIFNFSESLTDQEKSIQKGVELLSADGIKKEWQTRSAKMRAEKIDVTDFIVWFIENYPKSISIMKDNPDYPLCFN